MQIFLASEQYENVIAKILAVEPSPFTGEIGRDEITLALAEADIMPVSVLPDVLKYGG